MQAWSYWNPRLARTTLVPTVSVGSCGKPITGNPDFPTADRRHSGHQSFNPLLGERQEEVRNGLVPLASPGQRNPALRNYQICVLHIGEKKIGAGAEGIYDSLK